MEPKLIDYDLDNMPEDEATFMAIDILQQRIKNNKQNAGCSLGCSIIFLLLWLLIFQDVPMESGEIGGSGVTSIIENIRYKRIVKQLYNGTNKISSVDYLKMLRADQSIQEIWSFIGTLWKNIKENTVDFSGIWKHIDCYEDYCRENPKSRLKKVDRAIETINREYRKYMDEHPETPEPGGDIEE